MTIFLTWRLHLPCDVQVRGIEVHVEVVWDGDLWGWTLEKQSHLSTPLLGFHSYRRRWKYLSESPTTGAQNARS